MAGVTSGLIGMGEEVTWEARHFGIRQKLRVKVTEFDQPSKFVDVMISGAFKSMIHQHNFVSHSEGAEMKDRFEFTSPWGLLGQIADRVFLTGYMRRFLIERNQILKSVAESEEWKKYVSS